MRKFSDTKEGLFFPIVYAYLQVSGDYYPTYEFFWFVESYEDICLNYVREL